MSDHLERGMAGAGQRPVRIANCSGFYGDRLTALEEMVTGGPVDVVTGDYLAEVTMLVLARSRLRRPGGGYAATFLRQLAPIATEIAARGIKVVVNAGGLDPAGLANATRDILEQLGVHLVVSHVEGDDLTARIPELLSEGHELAHLDTSAPFATWGHEVLTANAYLGGFGIKAALRGGADIVVTGRVADASLASGVAAWWWDWSPDEYDALAGAVVAGHVIECGAQATGGNFSGFLDIGGLTHPGFPLAEIDRDGTSVITKHEGTGGAVSVDTVTAQLLYEIGAPDYLNPDVVARLDTVALHQVDEDRVAITGVMGRPAPITTKVAITGLGAWRNSTTVVLTGLEVDDKAGLFESTVRAQLEGDEGINDLRFTRIGRPDQDPEDQMAGSCLLQIAVDGEESSCGRAFSSLLVGLALSNFPGIYYTDVPSNGSPYGVYWPTLIDQSIVGHVVAHADGRREAIPAHLPDLSLQASDHDLSHHDLTADFRYQPLVTDTLYVDAPLGVIANARSGDKGGNANVGIWVQTSAAWRWLLATMTVQQFKELVPEAAGLHIDRFELANLKAVNFVVHELLDGGATEARRFDKQAKALGEYLRARYLPIPAELLDPAT